VHISLEAVVLGLRYVFLEAFSLGMRYVFLETLIYERGVYTFMGVC